MSKFKSVLLMVLLFVYSKTAYTEVALEAELVKRCLSSFEIMENNDIDAFISLMPTKPSDEEKEYAKKLLRKKQHKWYVKSGGILKMKEGKVIFQKPSQTKKERYGADNQVKTKLRVETKNFNSNTSCTFVHTPKGWFLSILP